MLYACNSVLNTGTGIYLKNQSNNKIYLKIHLYTSQLDSTLKAF